MPKKTPIVPRPSTPDAIAVVFHDLEEDLDKIVKTHYRQFGGYRRGRSEIRSEANELFMEAYHKFDGRSTMRHIVAWSLELVPASLAPTLIVLEATGGYEPAVVAAVVESQLSLVVVHPRQVRDFAKTAGEVAKTEARMH